MTEYLCPFCFNAVDLNGIHYQCTNQSCTRLFVKSIDEGRVPNGRAYRTASEDEEIDVENSLFLGRNPDGPDAVTTKQHIVRNSTGTCDMCGRPVYKRLCPVCHSPIPPEAESANSRIFVVVGAKGAGKSHYVSVLLNQIKNSFSPEFNAVLVPASDRTTMKYRKYYYKRLYEDGRKLPPTRTYENIREFREPMIYYLKFPEDETKDTVTLALFDTAGEGPKDKLMGIALDLFVSRASGIIFLIDPLQIPYINDRIKVDGKPSPSDDTVNYISSMSEMIRSGTGTAAGGKISTPLAIVLTKCDTLMKSPENDEEEKILLGACSSVRMPRERGIYDLENFEQINIELEEYLRRAISPDFIEAVDNFEKHSYFAVSAIGGNPEGSLLDRGISPFRVEDPLIWLLSCYDRDSEDIRETEIGKED